MAEKAIKIGIAFIAVVALDTNIAPMGNPYPRALALLSMVSGAMDINTNHVGVKVTIQTWSSATALAQKTPWPQVAARATQISVALVTTYASGAIMAAACSPDQGIHATFVVTSTLDFC